MQQHLLRLKHGRRTYYFLSVLLVLLASCSSPKPVEIARGVVSHEFVVTVPLNATDTPAAIEHAYEGQIIVWEPGVYALVGVDTTPVQALSLNSSVVVEGNQNVFTGGGAAAHMNGRSSLWAGGRSSLWAGGRSSLWAGGRSSLWAGGEFTWLPENTATWQQIRLQEGQNLAQNLGYGVKVAIIDTGVDLNHPALQEALAPAAEWYDFYDHDAVPQEEGTLGQGGYGHGTNVAGIIRQIAPRATLLPLRVLGPDGQGDVADLAAAIQWATAKGANIINLSLGSDSEIKAVDAAIKQATAKGVLVVASTGNTADKNVTWPASSAVGKENLQRMSVTSVDAQDKKSSFATYGKSVELAAPGENVYGPAPEQRLAAWSGTSMAAPMASGALALALGETRKVPSEKLIEELMKESSDLYGHKLNEKYKNQIGKGRLDLEAFLRDVIK